MTLFQFHLVSSCENCSSRKNSGTKITSIGQAIIQAARPRVLIASLQIGVAVQMHHHFGSEFFIDSLNSHGFCSSYSKVKKFEVSAADAQDKEIPGFIPGQFAQFIMLTTMSKHLTAPIPFIEWA